MPFSLFVYYNSLVRISKTTKDTTLAQENFFSSREIPFQMALFLSRSDGVDFCFNTLVKINLHLQMSEHAYGKLFR